MGKMVSYHPVYWVKHADMIYRLDVTCDNWYDDAEIIGQLADIVGTAIMGGIVLAARKHAVRGGFVLDTQCLEYGRLEQAFAAQDVIDWDMPVGQIGRDAARLAPVRRHLQG